MAVLLKCGAIFLHIPKTGGNWVSEVLEANDLVYANVGGRHCGAEQMAPMESLFRMPYRYDKPNRPFFKFCFVRHPLRWYESWFKMMSRIDWINWGDEPGYWYPPVLLNGLGDADFAVFVERVLRQRPGFVAEMYAWYMSHGVHFVGRQESMADDLATVLRYLGLTFDEEGLRRRAPVNVSRKVDLIWPADLQRAVERAELSAFRRFGYRTELFLPDEPDDARMPGPGFEAGLAKPLRLAPPYAREIGKAWQAALPGYSVLADDLIDPYRSMLVLFEDGRRLPQAHALHDDIRNAGGGRYSHWQNHLIFSTSDGSDPNSNGRAYEARFLHTDGAARDHLRLEAYAPAPAKNGKR